MNLQISNYEDYCRYTNTCDVCGNKLHEEKIEYMSGGNVDEDIIMTGHALGCNGLKWNYNAPRGLVNDKDDVLDLETKHWAYNREIQENRFYK